MIVPRGTAMKPLKLSILTIGIACLLTFTATAQRVAKLDKTRPSPDDIVTATVGGVKVTVEYGRPYKKGRQIFGGLVPYGQVWRTGANEATVLTVDGDLMVGQIHVPKGSYALFTIPGEKQWVLILNKVWKQWGAFKYDATQDLGRDRMTVRKLSTPVEQLTISIEPGTGKSGTLKIAWDDVEASIGLMAH